MSSKMTLFGTKLNVALILKYTRIFDVCIAKDCQLQFYP